MAKAPAPKTRIQKAGSGHAYYLDGEWCPGVTTILGNAIPKPALMSWAAKAPAELVANTIQVAKNEKGELRYTADELIAEARAWQETRNGKGVVKWSDHTPLPRAALEDALQSLRFRDLDQASHKGTTVHNLAHQLAQGLQVEVPDLLAGHVKSYLKFLTDWKPHDALIERVIVNRRWRYMGKFDMIASFDPLPEWFQERCGKESGSLLIDIKTSRSGVFAETALQVEAYRNGETMLEGAGEVPMPSVDGVGALWVRTDGYDFYGFDINSTTRPTTFEIFAYAIQLSSWLDWKNGPASTIRSDSLKAGTPQ